MRIKYVTDRFIYLLFKDGELSSDDLRELAECKKKLKKHVVDEQWRNAKILNLAELVKETNDWDWGSEIGERMQSKKGF